MRYLSTKNRSILQEMVRADFKVRYQGSTLGYVWSVLRPLFMFGILYVVFTYIFKLGKSIEHYPVYLLLGLILWNFFTETTAIGMSAVVGKGDLIRKISIPRYLTVISSSLSALINLGINLVVLLAFAFFNGVEPTVSWLLLPVILVELYAFSTALAFFLAALYVKYRDVAYVWEVGVQAAFYATPIVYPLTLVAEEYRRYFLLSPMTQIIQDARNVFVTDTSITIWDVAPLWFAVIPILIVISLVFWSSRYFKNQAKWFAENI